MSDTAIANRHARAFSLAVETSTSEALSANRPSSRPSSRKTAQSAVLAEPRV